MDEKIAAKLGQWYSGTLRDWDLEEELLSITENESALEERFYKDLEFGTGGLRGIIGAGTNRMNIYTVGKATQGYCNYLKKTEHGDISVAIAYDSRLKSDLFANISAEIFAANGICVKLFGELMPTPALSFAVRTLKCAGGIVITASHNPAKYNGYKVYNASGCQITAGAADAILKEINSVDMFQDVKFMGYEDAVEGNLISIIPEEVVLEYIEEVSKQSLCKDELLHKKLPIVYSPLNGAGYRCVTKCLKRNGFSNVHVVEEQKCPDSNFTTCPRPNPEEGEAMKLGIRDAGRLNSELVLATDPDCDRLGLAVYNGSDYVLLSGNETGILLCKYICERRTALHLMPENPVIMKTIVTTDLIDTIAADYGVRVINVLTGFKYIGEKIDENPGFILGAEESYGYLTGAYVRDKDGVNASLMVCEMFAYYKEQGKSLLDVLYEIYQKYGFCLNTQHNYQFEGKQGFFKMQSIMETLRKGERDTIFHIPTVAVSDYKLGAETNLLTGKVEKIELPVSDVLKLSLKDQAAFIVRPSGTEPKLKIYISVHAENEDLARSLEKELCCEMEQFLKD